jgi:hypothetical protein
MLTTENNTMFRKIWKTIRIFLILGIIAICMPHSILPRSEKKKGDNNPSPALSGSESAKDLVAADSLVKQEPYGK